ncbi:DUF5777 family beta-barrel protein [Paraflavitalea sp. CAU 1676]|uniref:DUF5777 family beta-barrel protein n=1 Tax=Paraflavitalea sp. CAU 1676 TaxID=3032598 RepID=UPI0023DA9549|nr:DUF5777 family beta-barrel protein [Paraflavitalea sp. CAU 1676]MDF2193625.1 DUF5777 family beta-barrel protein [Paraflavitalea sp. CAU 1676]
MNKRIGGRLAALLLLVVAHTAYAQDEDLLKQLGPDTAKKEYVKNAFKSSRVINNHSMEFIGKGVMDVRILHRFGTIQNGFEDLFGLDEANTRFGFDYGVGKSLTIGIGRSNVNKELDGFIKYRPIWQSKGPGGFPFSVVLITGMTVRTQDFPEPKDAYEFKHRLAFFQEVIIGRKFSEGLSLQLNPIFLHRNLVPGAEDDNNTWALGMGGRVKLSKRTAFVLDYTPILAGRQEGTKDPIAMGFDFETGGHVFQLHFTNAIGMNERAFLTTTTDDFWKGEIRFGFNLSRVFTLSKKK